MTRFRIRLAALLSLAAAPVQAQTQAAPAPARLGETIDSIAGRARGIPVEGMTIAVARGGRVLFEKGYGLADVERQEAATAATVYEIGSMTKQLTAAAVLRLAEEGKLGLDDEIGGHLPALAEKGRGVTLRHLLSHTSGLYSGRAVRDLTAPADPRAVVDTLVSRPVEFAPGERYRYNNNGFILLGLVVEQATGKPFAEHLRDAFLVPLGMRATAVCGTLPGAPLAKGYEHPTRGPATPAPATRHHVSTSFSAGFLCSTAGDMLRWQQALAGGRVVSPGSYRLMTTPTVLASGRKTRYGLGTELGELEGRPFTGHGGASAGFVATMGRYPADSLDVVVLTNGIYAGSIVDQIRDGVARAALGLPQRGVPDLPLPAEERARFVGTYDLGKAKVEVYAQGDHLRAQPPGQVASRLLYQGDGVFVAEHDPASRLRFRVEGGRAAELVLQHGERALPPARRLP